MLPWSAPEESVLIPNLPIPTTPKSYVRTAGDPTFPNLQWTIEVTVSPGQPIRKYLDPCEVYASVIGCEDQTLGESIPLTGVPFGLHYRSDRFDPPSAKGGWTWRSLTAAGWSLAVHHSFDPATGTLYLGDGNRLGPAHATLPAGALGPEGAVLAADRTGSEAYLLTAPAVTSRRWMP
jgi:hypothetical protein